MPYLAPHFDPDIFVSYSHGDPIGDRAPLRDWTQALVRRLFDGLHALETEFDALHIWMDQIDPTVFLTDELKGKARACGLLMIVMSKRYLMSSWCRQELEWVKDQIEDRAAAGGRVFVIRAQQTDTSLWPDFLRDMRGHALPSFTFYDPENGFPLDFLREPGDAYLKELMRLQIWLTKRLRELREGTATRAQNARVLAPPQPPGPRLIYLHAPLDGESARAEIDLALKADGILALTAAHGRAGRSFADWQREANLRIETAQRCEALVLLRLDDSDRFVNDLLGIAVEERKRISDARAAPMPCAVLDKTGESLPIDVTLFGIERFDINRSEWRGEFRAWLDAARGRPAGVVT